MDRSKTNCPSVIREDRIREIHVTSSGTGAAFPDLVLWNPASASGLDELEKVGVDLILVSGGQAVWRARIDFSVEFLTILDESIADAPIGTI
jgi:hypothetical protein